MRLVTRYVLAEVGLVFAFALAALTLLMILVGAVREALHQGLGVEHVVRLLPYLLPNALLFAVPGTVLLAVALVYGRMSNYGEIIALKSAGINPLSVLWPVFVLATVMSLGTVWLNDVAVSWGYQGVQRVVLTAVEDIAYGMLRTQRSYSTPQFSVNVKRVDGRKLINPTFRFQASGDKPSFTISAEEAELRSNPDDNGLTISFLNSVMEVEGRASMELPGPFELVIPLDEVSRKVGSGVSPSHVPLRDIPKRLAQTRLAIKQGEQAIAAEAAWRLLTGDLAKLTGPPQTPAAQNLGGLRDDLHKLATEPPRRWANGFSCLCFVLVGAPLAILRRSGDALTSFFICFVPILAVYYPLMMWGVDRSKAGDWSPYTVWMANLACLAAGAWFLRKVWRY